MVLVLARVTEVVIRVTKVVLTLIWVTKVVFMLGDAHIEVVFTFEFRVYSGFSLI